MNQDNNQIELVYRTRENMHNPLTLIDNFSKLYFEETEPRKIVIISGDAFTRNGLNFMFEDGKRTYKLKVSHEFAEIYA